MLFFLPLSTRASIIAISSANHLACRWRSRLLSATIRLVRSTNFSYIAGTKTTHSLSARIHISQYTSRLKSQHPGIRSKQATMPDIPSVEELISYFIATTDSNLDTSNFTPEEKALLEQLREVAADLSKLQTEGGKDLSNLPMEKWAELIPKAQETMRALVPVMRESETGEGEVGEVEDQIEAGNRILEGYRSIVEAEVKMEREGEVKEEGGARDGSKGDKRGGERGDESPA